MALLPWECAGRREKERLNRENVHKGRDLIENPLKLLRTLRFQEKIGPIASTGGRTHQRPTGLRDHAVPRRRGGGSGSPVVRRGPYTTWRRQIAIPSPTRVTQIDLQLLILVVVVLLVERLFAKRLFRDPATMYEMYAPAPGQRPIRPRIVLDPAHPKKMAGGASNETGWTAGRI